MLPDEFGVNTIQPSSPHAPPRPARRVAQHDDRPACHRDFLQLAAGEERDPLAVRREERQPASSVPIERRRFELIEAADVQLPDLARLFER